MIKPDWETFNANFTNKEEMFEWFSYLLFCREFNLPKGWLGFNNQSAIEKIQFKLMRKLLVFRQSSIYPLFQIIKKIF